MHRRPTYRRTCRCPVRGVLVAPPVPKAIGKGRFTTGFLARLLCEKFVLGRPAHRIVAGLAHDGLDVAEGTLAGVFAACADLLAPLAALITERNSAAAHLHIDETVRHEALQIRVEVRGLRLPVVAAAGCSWGQPCDVMSHVMSDHTDGRSLDEDVIRSRVQWTVSALACVAGDCGVRSPG